MRLYLNRSQNFVCCFHWVLFIVGVSFWPIGTSCEVEYHAFNGTAKEWKDMDDAEKKPWIDSCSELKESDACLC